MKTALMVFASDLIDEGFEAVADVARDRGGFEAIELAAIYHHARDVHPHNPVHRVLFLDGGALFFRPDPRAFSGQRIQPHLAGVLDRGRSAAPPACGGPRARSLRARVDNQPAQLHSRRALPRCRCRERVRRSPPDRPLPGKPRCSRLRPDGHGRALPRRGGCHRGRVDLLHALRPRLPSRADALPTQRDDPLLPQPLLLPSLPGPRPQGRCRRPTTCARKSASSWIVPCAATPAVSMTCRSSVRR